MSNKMHFIGIGGIGMSGLARLMLNKNCQISGSDIASNAIAEGLSKAGATVHIGHKAENITPDMTIVYSTDIKKDNPEYQAALQLKCPIMHRSELLQQIMENFCALAVAGTHGKTTTSSLLTWVLKECGLAPSFAIGGVVPQLATNAHEDKGKHFVAEACESDGTFLNYRPNSAIVTNIDFDHMDYYGSETALIAAFKKFMEQVKDTKHLFWCGDDSRLEKLNAPGINYGFGNHCQLRGSQFQQKGWTTSFDIEFQGKTYAQVEVALTGKHNALNSLAVFGLALSLGIDENAIRAAFKSFGGVLRRCEKKGESHGILFLDDYAHHPTELKATLKAIRSAIGERRLVVVYQPHRYSRAKDCMGHYKGVFNDVDALFVTEIYAAREQPIPGVTHELIIEEIQNDLKKRCQFVERQEAADKLRAFIRPHDVVVSLGAGDLTNLSKEILALLLLKAPSKLKVGVICGGMSVEHRVSLLSAEYILQSVRSELYEIEEFCITYDGHWIAGPNAAQKAQKIELKPDSPKISSDVFNKIMTLDILFPILHGTFGEDGTIQGFFETAGKAYVGCDHRSAAISMDKTATKKILIADGLPTLPFVALTHYQWTTDSDAMKQKINAELSYPIFVKPIHLGSSIGVHKVSKPEELEAAIEDAFIYDGELIIENGIEMREIEFALIGNDQVVALPPGEIYTQGQMQDYHGKYGMDGHQPLTVVGKTDLPKKLIDEGIELVKKAYSSVGCKGFARIDTFLDKNNKFWINEINPIPGCTKNSMFPLICAANGFQSNDLVDRLIVLGLERKRKLDRLQVKA